MDYFFLGPTVVVLIFNPFSSGARQRSPDGFGDNYYWKMSKLSRSFDVEKEMWIPATKWLTGQDMGYKREFRVPWGICDLVGVEWSYSRVNDRIRQRQNTAIGPPGRVAMLQWIPDQESGRSIGITELSSLMRQPVEWVERELESLIRGRFVKRNSDGSLASRISWAPLHTRIVAVELKLDRIEEAINQARSHTAFATESYVGFPAAVAERLLSSHHLTVLQKAGVGLLSVTEAATSVLSKPASSSTVTRDRVLQMHCVERFWAKRFWPQLTGTAT